VKVRTIVKGKNFEVPDRVRQYAERKMRRLERVVAEPTDAIVELSVEHHRSAADSHLVDVSLLIHGRTVLGRAAALTHEAGIDDVVDKLERRATDHKARRVARHRTGGVPAGRDVAEEAPFPEPSGQITKVKSFDIEPMFEEDAIARMEELGHAFFVFVNAEGERVNVLYRRGAGDYGLIDPIVRMGPVDSRPRTVRA
jgi:putative sigma-54 modulation protein